jgi:hypothetical protein
MLIRPGNYLVTGIAGTGKTSVMAELSRRGFHAYSTDEMPEVSCFADKATGQLLTPAEAARAVGSLAWHWKPNGLPPLLARHMNTSVFIGASVANQYEYLSMFDSLFVLLINEDTLCERIVKRGMTATEAENSYGKRSCRLSAHLVAACGA